MTRYMTRRSIRNHRRPPNATIINIVRENQVAAVFDVGAVPGVPRRQAEQISACSVDRHTPIAVRRPPGREFLPVSDRHAKRTESCLNRRKRWRGVHPNSQGIEGQQRAAAGPEKSFTVRHGAIRDEPPSRHAQVRSGQAPFQTIPCRDTRREHRPRELHSSLLLPRPHRERSLLR